MNNAYLYSYQNLSLEDMEGEVWKPVKGFEEYYMASNMGRIKWLPRWIYLIDGRKRFVGEKIVTQYMGHTKFTFFLTVRFNIENTKHSTPVSRVIYSTFVKPLKSIRIERLYVLQYDSDPFNNKPENLYLATGKELTKLNIKKGYNKVLIRTPQVHNELTKRKSIPISQYSLTNNFICSYTSIRQASRETGIDSKSISYAARGQYHHAGGFIWRYKSGI